MGQGYPPIHDEVCQQDRCLKAIKAIRQSAPQFLPLKVGKDPRFKVWKNDMIIPLHFYNEAEGKPFVTLDDGDDEDGDDENEPPEITITVPDKDGRNGLCADLDKSRGGSYKDVIGDL